MTLPSLVMWKEIKKGVPYFITVAPLNGHVPLGKIT